MSTLKPEIVSFIKFVIKEIDIKSTFSIELSEDKQKFKTFAYYEPSSNKIAIYIKDRSIADVLRSIAHELVHHKQNQQNKLKVSHPDVGVFDTNCNINKDDIENQANAIAGSLIKKYGKTIRPDIYSL